MDNTAVKNGILSGIVGIIYSMILYFIDPGMMVGSMAYLGFLIPIIFMVLAAREEKAKNEGFLSFGEGLKVTILTVAIGMLLTSIFSYVLMNFIDPGMVDVIKEQAIAQAESMADMFGADEAGKEAMMESIEDQDFAPTILTSIMNFLVILIFPFFFIALIISAIVKKENKTFA